MTYLDGAAGTLFQSMGLPPGGDPTDWNIDNPDAVSRVHRSYADAGADIILANTFGANRLKYHGRHNLTALVSAGISLAKTAGVKAALDIGPTGRLLAPTGDLSFDAAYDAFAEQVRAGVDAGADLIVIETMGDTRELKAAVLAAKDASSLPVWATVALGENGTLLTGADVDAVAVLLEGLGVDAYGFNCGLGPDRLLPHVRRLATLSSKPIIVKPNAGLPTLIDGASVFSIGPDAFAEQMARLVTAGASIVGGCCGTTPAHIAALRARRLTPVRRACPAPRTVISSGTETVELHPGDALLVGERINPTGKKKLQEAYRTGDTAVILREAVDEDAQGARVLDINCGVPGLDEEQLLDATIQAVEGVTTRPLQIDTAVPRALARALRHVNGKPLVNSVNGTRASMDAVFPLVRRMGGVLVALCLDEQGIPPTADGRLAVARRILAEGERYGFRREDFVFDALTLAVSTDPHAAIVTLETVRRLTDELKVNTILGVSNISFGLPNRPALNAAMYRLAKKAGLSAAIFNPAAPRAGDDPAADDVLLGRDPGCRRWLARQAANSTAAAVSTPAACDSSRSATLEDLSSAIQHGLKADAVHCARTLLQRGVTPMVAVERGIVPALETIGGGFEKGTVFLPQLLMAADAAGAAFTAVRAALPAVGTSERGQPGIVLATVKGDIHDIGKNIVCALLENYGFPVLDLGRDVAPERILAAARESQAFLVCLSALMTTTVGAMEETVALFKREGLACPICVGGAVVTQDYADSIGADYYAKDAMRTVRIAESLRPSRV